MTLKDRPFHKGWMPWAPLLPILAILFVAVPLLLVSELLANFNLVDEIGDPIGYWGFVSFLIAPFSAMALTVFVWVKFVEQRSFSTLNLSYHNATKKLIMGFSLGLGTTFMLVLTLVALGYLGTGDAFPAFEDTAFLLQIFVLLLCFSVQSGVEEFLFRGWLLSAACYKVGQKWAIAINVGVFTFLHWSPDQPWFEIASSVTFALFACLLVINTGSVLVAAGWHIGWNWLMGTGFGLAITGADLNVPALLFDATPLGHDALSGGSEGPEGSIFCSLLLFSLSVYLWRARPANPDSSTKSLLS